MGWIFIVNLTGEGTAQGAAGATIQGHQMRGQMLSLLGGKVLNRFLDFRKAHDDLSYAIFMGTSMTRIASLKQILIRHRAA
jgi:hypothetical protein